MRRKRQLPRKKYREGFEFEGRWITPDEAHRACKELMDRVDRLPKEKRSYLKEHGKLPDE
jgi:hypothetical protein